MVKPRMIILVRHAQSEGNKNRDIHQYIPDHRVKLTQEGWQQAEDAGRRLRSMLRPDDTLQFYTSPYRRTRETTEGILRTLTSEDPEQGPSPFPKHKIKVYEEPRLREQDFGNFQPCSAEMERMWQERADYGHFFYRIPNGESAADAYDRCSGFNESLWRQFGETTFPSVCVLVTHGLMTRIFLMKWYHWSVEYFEDLRNINHCEFIIMKLNPDNGKYVLDTQLRTWSDLSRRAAAAQGVSSVAMKRSDSVIYTQARRWGGCINGCDHAKWNYPKKPRRQNTADFMNVAPATASPRLAEKEFHAFAPREEEKVSKGNATQVAKRKQSTSSSKSTGASVTAVEAGIGITSAATAVHIATSSHAVHDSEHIHDLEEAADNNNTIPSESDEGDFKDSEDNENEGDIMLAPTHHQHHHQHHPPMQLPPLAANPLRPGRDIGGSRSGVASPPSGSDDDSDYFDTNVHQLHSRLSVSMAAGHGHAAPRPRSDLSRSILAQLSDDDGSAAGSPKHGPARSPSRRSLKERPRAGSKGRERASSRGNSSASGVGKGSVASRTEQEWFEESGMLSGKKADALGDMGEGEGEGESSSPPPMVGKITEAVVESMKLRDRKGFGEIY